MTVLNSQDVFSKINKILNGYTSHIKNTNKLYLYDAATFSEDFYSTLLGIVLNKVFKNLNYENPNQSSVDLVDMKSEVMVQVTSEYSQKKLDKTIESFRLNSNFKKVQTLLIVFISDSSKPLDLAKHNRKYSFDIEYMTTVDLLKLIKPLGIERKELLLNFLESELGENILLNAGLCKSRTKSFLPREFDIVVDNDLQKVKDFFNISFIKIAVNTRTLSLMKELVLELLYNLMINNKSKDKTVKLVLSLTKIELYHSDIEQKLKSMLRVDREKLESGKNMGTKILQDFMLGFRDYVRLDTSILKNNQKFKVKNSFTFNVELIDIIPLHECSIHSREVLESKFYNGCDVVYFMPESKVAHMSKWTRTVNYGLENLPAGFVPGLVLKLEDLDSLDRLRREYPGIKIKILETGEVI